MLKKRYLEEPITEDLKEKMVFMAGPRQVGKTTLAKQILSVADNGRYYAWDNRGDRQAMMSAAWPADKTLIVFDELHKYRKWKRWLKGEYDKHKDHLSFLVTGSARLDVYRRGGDSLQGRYHHLRLHPFSFNELKDVFPNISLRDPLSFRKDASRSDFEVLLEYGGFPEPLLAQSKRTHRRWQKERIERFFREDLRDLENVRDLSSIQLLSDILPERVGSPLSLNSLREDLEVSHRAITHWVDILERMYFLFRIPPFTTNKVRSVKKEAKAYMWDWTLIEDRANRLENMVASHLLKFCHYLEDTEGHAVELFYLRDVNRREVDFLVTIKKKPWFAVEVKSGETNVSPHLRYFSERMKIPYIYQVVADTETDALKDEVRIMSIYKFLSGLI